MNLTTFQYDLIYTFNNFQTFTIKEYFGRMIITGANITSNVTSNGFSDFLQEIFFFGSPNNTLILIDSIVLNGSAIGQNNIPIFTSPLLTKMGYSYIPIGPNATMQIFAKSIDYINMKVIDIIYDDPIHALQTFSTSNVDFDFNDYFLVVRNTSGLMQNPTANAVEEAYQIVGNKIMYLDSRILTGSKELNQFLKLYVDQYYINTLVLLDVYNLANASGI